MADLAVRLGLPRATLDGTVPSVRSMRAELGRRPFSDPDPFQELAFPSPLAAKSRELKDHWVQFPSD